MTNIKSIVEDTMTRLKKKVLCSECGSNTADDDGLCYECYELMYADTPDFDDR